MRMACISTSATASAKGVAQIPTVHVAQESYGRRFESLFGPPRFPQTLKSRSNQIRHARYVGTNYDMGDRWVNRHRYDLLVIISDAERLEAYWLPRSRNPLDGTSVQVSLSEDTGPYPTHQRPTDFKDLG
jgi:hypothetical protein